MVAARRGSYQHMDPALYNGAAAIIALAMEETNAFRGAAIFALARNRTDASVKALKSLLNDTNAEIRY